MHVNDIAKQLPFTIEPHEIEYLSLIGEYKKSPIKALKQIRARTRKASDEALFESCNKLFQLSKEIRFLEKFLVNMEGCA